MNLTKFLPILYLILIILSFFRLIPTNIIVYGIAALIITLAFLIYKKENEIKLKKQWLYLALILILITRILPYLGNTIPLGYDAGIYKYGIENKIDENWEKTTFDPLFNLLMKSLNLIFPATLILTLFLILFELFLGFNLYITIKEYFNKNTAILSTLLFSLSIVQFKAFTLLYYKNIIAMSFLLLSFYFLKKKRIYFIISSIITAGIHRPTFLILALSFLIYTFYNYKNNLKKNIISGIIILIGALILYIDRLKIAVIPGVTEAIGLAIGGGTFINLISYKSLLLIYIPFLAIGLYTIFHEKKTNILFIWFLINFSLVVFKLIFFNRYIIMLDLITIVIVSIGLLEILKDNRKVGVVSLLLIFAFLSYNVIGESLTSKPLISHDELNEIKELNNIEENAVVLATSSYYSPWVLGYSERKTYAPGLFEDNHTLEQWQKFWDAESYNEIKDFLNDYEKPLYIHAGSVNRFKIEKFKDKCFEEIIGNKTWKVVC